MSEIVQAGDHRVGRGAGRFMVRGLGSCVAVILYDDRTRVGGLAHVLLPDPSFSTNPDRRMRFATTAVPDLVEELLAAGACKEGIGARLVGGASMFRDLLPNDRPNMGERNVVAVRAALSEAAIPVLGEDVGGDYGRTVCFELSDGKVCVKTPRREDVVL